MQPTSNVIDNFSPMPAARNLRICGRPSPESGDSCLSHCSTSSRPGTSCSSGHLGRDGANHDAAIADVNFTGTWRGHRSRGHLRGHARLPARVAGTFRRRPSRHFAQKPLRHQEMWGQITCESLCELIDPFHTLMLTFGVRAVGPTKRS